MAAIGQAKWKARPMHLLGLEKLRGLEMKTPRKCCENG